MKNLITRKGAKLQLDGDKLTGETFAVKDFVKSYCDGKWNAETKSWTVNVDKVNRLITNNNSIGLRIDTDTKTEQPKFGSYEHFLQSADDPNSDY